MHTPTPYRYSDRNWRNEQQPHDRYIRGDIREDEDGTTAVSVAIVPGNATSGTIADETAAFICRACNSFDAMLAALKLHVAYEATPTDRGGTNGTKGRAWSAFVAARDAAIAMAEQPLNQE